MINASARYEYININNQLVDFHLNRMIKNAKRQKQKLTEEQITDPLNHGTVENFKLPKKFDNPVQIIQERVNTISPLPMETMYKQSLENKLPVFFPNIN